MSDIKLFKYKPQVKEMKGASVSLEKDLQTVIEKNMQEFFGVTFLASEYAIDSGRMDSVGIDENNCPVIFEYKRRVNQNVINQGLYYLDWMLEHKDSFELLVLKKLGQQVADQIDWSIPRLICVAEDYNRYDERAIKLIKGSISLIRYKKFDDEILMFELINSIKSKASNDISTKENSKYAEKTFNEQYESAPAKMKNIYGDLREYTLSLGDDVSENTLKKYTAFKKIKNFVTMEIYSSKILVDFRLNPDNFTLTDNLRDIRAIGHWGCGGLQYIIKSEKDIEYAKELIQKAYNEN